MARLANFAFGRSWLTAIILLASAQGGLCASIFDDNWTPPVAVKHVQPTPEPAATQQAPSDVKPVPSPAPPITPATPPTPVPAPAPVATLPPANARRPIPAKVDRAKSRKLFEEAFSKELANRSVTSRRTLAATLISEAAKTTGMPSDEFVLLQGATEAAKEGQDLGLCLEAADKLSADYEIDGLPLKADLAQKVVAQSGSGATARENCLAAIKLVNQLAAADDYSACTRIMSALRAASPDAATSSLLQARTKAIDAQRIANERMIASQHKLSADPNNPTANSVVGQFLCFYKRDWARGLPLLAKGDDSELHDAAAKELQNPSEAKDMYDLAGKWWDLGNEKKRAANQLMMRARADYWYEKALPGLSALQKALAEQRLDEMGPPNILRGMLKDGPADPVAVDGTIRLKRGALKTPNEITVPFRIDVVGMTDSTNLRLRAFAILLARRRRSSGTLVFLPKGTRHGGLSAENSGSCVRRFCKWS